MVEVRPAPRVQPAPVGPRSVAGPGPGRAPVHDDVLEVDDPEGPVAQAVLQATRLRLLALLSSDTAQARGGYSLQELRDMLGCSPQNVHHHLRVLVDVGAAFLARSEGAHNVPRQYWCSHVRRIRLRMQARTLDPVFVVELEAATPRSDAERRLLADLGEGSPLRALVESGVVRAIERLPPGERRALRDALDADPHAV